MATRPLLLALLLVTGLGCGSKDPAGPGDNAGDSPSTAERDGDDTGMACPDEDGDGVCDTDDICTGGDDNVDTDGDGNPDHCDLCPEDNPDDSDGDGVCDSVDECEGEDDLLDDDGDGVANGCDPCPLDNPDDTDGDTVCDSDDICDGDDLDDSDKDGIPDDCDMCPDDNPDDTDDDGVCDSSDACEGEDDFFDTDGDDVPDACDPCPEDAPDDSDLDGVCDSEDICEHHDDALDTDGDLIPDGCDSCPGHDDGVDGDGDSVADGCDICTGGDDLTDTDGDGTPNDCDACPLDASDDTDGDTICDSDDICAGGDDLTDTDGDGVPNDCDPCPVDASDDSDGDTICDSDDICAGGDDLTDTDEDDVPDDCDVCEGGDDALDGDSDGVADFCDPCPVDNPDDADGDGICDSDPIPLPNGLIAAWTGHLDEVPAGWSICDGTDGTPDLRDRFVLGHSSSDLGESTGSATHDHSGESDTTSLSTDTTSPGGRSCSYPGCWCTMKAYTASHSHDFSHSHAVAEDTLMPPYYEVIYLMNTGAESVPPGTVFAWLSTDAALSEDWELCDGAGVCPDLRGRFLKGASDGLDAGAIGGSETHDHGEATEVVTSTGSYSGGGRVVSSGGESATDANHSHGYEHDHWLTGEDQMPPYISLSWVTPLESSATASGAIAMWSGSLDELPEGWQLCDGTEGTPDLQDYFVRGASSDTEVGIEGGTETHDHALVSDPGGTTTLSEGGNGSCTDGGDLMTFHTHAMPGHAHSLASSGHIPPAVILAYIMYVPE